MCKSILSISESEGEKVIVNAVNWTIEEGLTTENVNANSPISCSSVGDNVVDYIRKKGKMSPLKLVDVEEDFLYR